MTTEQPGQRRHCFEYSTEQVPFCTDCHAARAFSSGEPQDALLKNGDRVFGTKFFPLKNEEGLVHSVISLASDITEKKRLQDEAQRAQHLAALGEIAAGIAHEINNPNALILLNATTLLEIMKSILPILEEYYQNQGDFMLGKMPYSRIVRELPELQREIVDASEKISAIVSEMREFINNGAPTNATSIDINSLATDVYNVARKLHPGTMIDCNLAADPPPANGDRRQLEQALVNLLQNGIEALPDEGGMVNLSTGYSADGTSLFFDIEDNGPGIPESISMQVTDPFFTTKRDRGGTGLGLAITTRIAKNHDGRLLFFPGPGKGTRVRLELPAHSRIKK